MKVVHLLPALEQGGVESVVCDLVRALPDVESIVVSKGGRLVDRVAEAGGRHIAMDLKSKNPLTYFSRVWRLRRVLRSERPDLVCVHSRVPAWLYVGVRKLDSVARMLGRPVAESPWISYAHGANSVSRYSEVMTKGDLVVAPSKFLADYLKTNYRITDAKIRVVPNPVDTERFDPARLDRSFVAAKLREWGIRDGDRVTMAIGRITPVKGLEGVIKRVGRGETLVVVGGADKGHRQYLESLEKLAKALESESGGDRRIVFAGAQEKIPECISMADEIVSGNVTKPETFGLSVVEAYAMNKPVRVARRFGGVAEVMREVEQTGCATLREAVLRLYGMDRFAERTMAVYRECCA